MENIFQAALDCEAAGEFRKAYELLTQCLSDTGRAPGEIAFHRGWCLENCADADRERAIGFYEQAAEKASDDALKSNACFRSGWLLLQQKEHGKAASSFKKVLDLARQAQIDSDLYHQTLFWYAVCLEHLGRYIEAAHCHDTVRQLSSKLSPESVYRKILCHNQVGNYEAAAAECRWFQRECPEGFSPSRFDQLAELIKKEELLLSRSLKESQPVGEEVSDARKSC